MPFVVCTHIFLTFTFLFRPGDVFADRAEEPAGNGAAPVGFLSGIMPGGLRQAGHRPRAEQLRLLFDRWNRVFYNKEIAWKSPAGADFKIICYGTI